MATKRQMKNEHNWHVSAIIAAHKIIETFTTISVLNDYINAQNVTGKSDGKAKSIRTELVKDALTFANIPVDFYSAAHTYRFVSDTAEVLTEAGKEIESLHTWRGTYSASGNMADDYFITAAFSILLAAIDRINEIFEN